MQIWGCQNHKIPEPSDTKYGMGEISLYAKIHNNLPSGGIPAHA